MKRIYIEMWAVIHSKIFGNFGSKLNVSARSNRKSFEKTGPPFEVDHFSRSDQLEFWLNRSRPLHIGVSQCITDCINGIFFDENLCDSVRKN